MNANFVITESQLIKLIRKSVINESELPIQTQNGNILYKGKEYTIEADTPKGSGTLHINKISPDPSQEGNYVMYYDVKKWGMKVMTNKKSKIDSAKINNIISAIQNNKLPFKTKGKDEKGEIVDLTVKES